MTNPYKCVILDDNEIDRLTALSLVRKYPFLNVEAMYSTPKDLLAEINEINPQVLFLDIDMPEMSGIELRKELLNVPACIFITSYPDYALESFEVSALDYLLKPVNINRFDMAMKRLKEYLALIDAPNQTEYNMDQDSFYIKEGTQQVKISLSDVLYLEALKDYTGIITRQKKHFVLSNLGKLLLQPIFESFVRIHRSYAVQKSKIDKIDSSNVYINNIHLPIGRNYKNNLVT